MSDEEQVEHRREQQQEAQPQNLPTRQELVEQLLAQLRMAPPDDVLTRSVLIDMQRGLDMPAPKNGQCVYCYKSKIIKGPSPRICDRCNKQQRKREIEASQRSDRQKEREHEQTINSKNAEVQIEQAKAAQEKEKRLAEEARARRDEAKAQALQAALEQGRQINSDPVQLTHALSAFFNNNQEERDGDDTKG